MVAASAPTISTTLELVQGRVEAREAPTPLVLDINEGLEIGVLLTGREERQYPDFATTCIPGDIWFCGMLEPHEWRFTSRGGSAVTVTFPPDLAFLSSEVLGEIPWLMMFTAPPALRPRVTTKPMRDTLLAVGRDLRHEIEAQPTAWQSALRVGILRILLSVGRDWRPPDDLRESARLLPLALARIMPALNAVRANPTVSISPRAAAAACNLSVAQFNRVFRQSMAMSFGEFGLRARLAMVAKGLRATRDTLETLADQAGFVDHSHLHRTFVRYYGCTPGQYRLLRRPTP